RAGLAAAVFGLPDGEHDLRWCLRWSSVHGSHASLVRVTRSASPYAETRRRRNQQRGLLRQQYDINWGPCRGREQEGPTPVHGTAFHKWRYGRLPAATEGPGHGYYRWGRSA